MHSYNPNEYYTKLAQTKKLRARSYFKLQEINAKFSLIKKSQTLLDLGAAPGAWSQYLFSILNQNATLWAIDTQKIKPFQEKITNSKFVFRQENVFSLPVDCFSELPNKFHGVLSDLAPATTGVKSGDSFASYQLVLQAAKIAFQNLQPKGFFVAKYLEGQEKKNLMTLLKSHFQKINLFRPKSTRQNSKELFFVCQYKLQ